MIVPLNWISVVIECGIKNLLNITTQKFDVCLSQNYMRYFTIDLCSSHINTQI